MKFIFPVLLRYFRIPDSLTETERLILSCLERELVSISSRFILFKIYKIKSNIILFIRVSKFMAADDR